MGSVFTTLVTLCQFFFNHKIEKWRSHGCTSEHLESVGTKIMMKDLLYTSYANEKKEKKETNKH